MKVKTKVNCILLVDDDQFVNAMNKILIDNAEYTHNLIIRESAIGALYYLTRSSKEKSYPFPDLILLDMDMPEIDGLDFMNFFSKIKDSLPRLPLIYILTPHLTKINISPDLAGIYQTPLTTKILDTIFAKHFCN